VFISDANLKVTIAELRIISRLLPQTILKHLELQRDRTTTVPSWAEHMESRREIHTDRKTDTHIYYMVISWREQMESQTDENTKFIKSSFMDKVHGDPAGQRYRFPINFLYGRNTWRGRTTQAQTSYKLLS